MRLAPCLPVLCLIATLAAPPALADAVGEAPWGPVDLVEDPAYCNATVAQWEEREPQVMEPEHLGNHYGGCSWDGRPLPWPLARGARFMVPGALCHDAQALPQARSWRTDITGRRFHDGRVVVEVPGRTPRRLTFHPCD
ncbi:hypothetical protein KUV28_18010 [Ferrimonas balearica]|nr:hypothetical protein [Ferrimonas balearica]